jgi:hypothetical protein
MSTPAPSALNPAISHTSRNVFKLRLASRRENLSPSSISAVTKAQPQSSSMPTAKILLDSHVPAVDTGKGGNSQTNKVLKILSTMFNIQLQENCGAYQG